MKKLSTQLSLILVILFTGSVLAQEPGITWTKLYKPTPMIPGTVPAAVANDGVQLPDGGYLAAGSTLNPWLKAYLVRTNSSGDTLWTHQYFDDPTSYGSFTCTDVEIANDGNYFLSGWGSHQATAGIWLLKVTTNGDTLWSRYFTKGSVDTLFVTYDMKVTPDGGVIIIGDVKQDMTINIDVFVLKYNSDGTFEWYRKLGHPADIDEGFTIENAWDGGYVLCCQYDSIGDQLRLIKIDNAGQQQWSVVYPFETLDKVNDYSCIIRTNDNNYVISGEASFDYFLMKVDQAGGIIWLHSYGFPGTGQLAYWVAQTTDGGYIITGHHNPEGTTDDVIYVVKTDNNGEEEWNKQIKLNYNDRAYKVHQTLDNGYLLYGHTRIDPDGMDHLLMMKLGGSSAIEDQSTSNSSEVIRNYPNPVTSMTTIQYSLAASCQVSLKLFDIEGNEIETLVNKKQSAGKHELHVNSQNLPAGIYYYRLSAGAVNSTGKMTVIK